MRYCLLFNKIRCYFSSSSLQVLEVCTMEIILVKVNGAVKPVWIIKTKASLLSSYKC